MLVKSSSTLIALIYFNIIWIQPSSSANFSSHFMALSGSVAQLVEQRTENPCVAGSIPARATLFFYILQY